MQHSYSVEAFLFIIMYIICTSSVQLLPPRTTIRVDTIKNIKNFRTILFHKIAYQTLSTCQLGLKIRIFSDILNAGRIY